MIVPESKFKNSLDAEIVGVAVLERYLKGWKREATISGRVFRQTVELAPGESGFLVFRLFVMGAPGAVVFFKAELGQLLVEGLDGGFFLAQQFLDQFLPVGFERLLLVEKLFDFVGRGFGRLRGSLRCRLLRHGNILRQQGRIRH